VCLDGVGGLCVLVFDLRRHSNVKRRAAYRRVGKYYKGLAKFKAEKLRRRRVLELRGEGLTVGEVARRLCVSESTVKRDLAKWGRFVKGRLSAVARELGSGENEKFLGLGLKAQVDCIRELGDQSLLSRRTLACSALVVTVDVDAALEGRYALKFVPRLPVDLLENGKITVELRVQGRKQTLGRLYVGEVTGGSVNLQTNQSLNVFVKHALKGLRVVEESRQPSESDE